ncbi:glycosyltransferase family 4 protein [Novosphingobium sp. BL-8H]|uniref:glycosyltransferase family 4 protein n=1 Tax=Novosphingobium sp. BL-8H TaxID=3127640 RepID=UPI00375710A4
MNRYQQDIPGTAAELAPQTAVFERKHAALVLPGLTAGGAERVVNIIADVLDRRGWKISVICFAESDSPSYYGYSAGVDVIRLDLPPSRQSVLTRKISAIRRAMRLRRALDEAAPDVVVSFLTRTNILALLAGLGRQTPIIVSERNNPKEQSVGPLWSWLRARLYPRAFGLVTMTKGAMECFPPAMRPRQWVIPNPVLCFERRDTAPTADKQITAVGRLVPQKGFDLLLKAFAKVVGEFPEWNLVIWGKGPERSNLEDMALRLGLQDRVRFAGVSERPGGWVDHADIFVMSSRYEGWGNALAEALAAGIPAISFDCNWGPGEFIDQNVNGLLVPPEDIETLAENMRELMRDPELRNRLGNNARAIAEALSANSVVDAWEKVMQEARDSRTSPASRHTAPSGRIETIIPGC